MVRIFVTIFTALLGLAFGSFLNVCVSRWPVGESIVMPHSHCRNCGRTLAWWENVPVLSWLALRGRCRTCGARIGLRYVLLEAAVGTLWAMAAWRFSAFTAAEERPAIAGLALVAFLANLILVLLLVALAALDSECLWLPDWLTWPGIALGFGYSLLPWCVIDRWPLFGERGTTVVQRAWLALESALLAAGIVLFLWAIYWLVRRKEGIGLGDAKLLAMLGAWMGFPGALLSLCIGVVLGAIAAVAMLARSRAQHGKWASAKLPLGTFLCIGGLINWAWGHQIIAAYLSWAGF